MDLLHLSLQNRGTGQRSSLRDPRSNEKALAKRGPFTHNPSDSFEPKEYFISFIERGQHPWRDHSYFVTTPRFAAVFGQKLDP